MELRALLLVILAITAVSAMAAAQDAPCPLNFTVLKKYADAYSVNGSGSIVPCQFVQQGLHLTLAEYLRTSGRFLPPANSSAACWSALQPYVSQIYPNFDPRPDCSIKTEWISSGCMNITTREEFETLANASSPVVLSDVERLCGGSLGGSFCAICTATMTRLNAFLNDTTPRGNVSDCTQYPLIYLGGVVNRLGPTNVDTTTCLYSLTLDATSILPPSPPIAAHRHSRTWIYGVIAGSLFLVSFFLSGAWFLYKKRRQRKKRKRRKKISPPEISQSAIQLDSVGSSTTLICYSLEEIKSATSNFSHKNIIGKGGYGNVYKGLLPDGSQVALKRFKNCSAAGDEEFRHEVEVIASVRHVNLVGLRGYCIATTPLEGHQRIIVCDLMKNGSLHDHLFGWISTAKDKSKLSWPIRQRIAVGTARGISYLHNGIHPSIIHRDIKASNILLDDDFEPKVADFGLARFAPEGVTHVSTRVAGTLGYLAPEYALYGQLTERSDVYSYGVLLLELLSGRKAITNSDTDRPSVITDWAWGLVREGRSLEVIEAGIPELGPTEVLEKYVMVAVLASHPQLYARPLMDNIVKILESDLVVPAIPDRPIAAPLDLDGIEESFSSVGSAPEGSFTGEGLFVTAKEG